MLNRVRDNPPRPEGPMDSLGGSLPQRDAFPKESFGLAWERSHPRVHTARHPFGTGLPGRFLWIGMRKASFGGESAYFGGEIAYFDKKTHTSRKKQHTLKEKMRTPRKKVYTSKKKCVLQ